MGWRSFKPSGVVVGGIQALVEGWPVEGQKKTAAALIVEGIPRWENSPPVCSPGVGFRVFGVFRVFRVLWFFAPILTNSV